MTLLAKPLYKRARGIQLSNPDYINKLCSAVEGLSVRLSDIKPDEAIDTLTGAIGLQRDDLWEQRRFAPVVDARAAVYFLYKAPEERTLTELARWFNQDHTTVLHHVKKFGEYLEAYRALNGCQVSDSS